MLKDQQYNHLTSNTPMKLLTTIAAVLISISAFSQDLVEYDKGTFTQNGEQLSMEQIDDLTLIHKAGRGNFRRGNRFDFMHKNPYIRSRNNTLNLLGGAATGIYGVTGIYTGVLGMFVGVYDSEPSFLRLGALFLGAGTGLCLSLIHI